MGVSENRGTLFWGPYNKDPTNYLGYYIRVPYFQKLPSSTLNTWRSSGWLLGLFNFLGFYMNHNKEAKSLTFRYGSSRILITSTPKIRYLEYSEAPIQFWF